MPNIYGANITQDQWDKIEKEFLAGFLQYFEELNESIRFLRKNKSNPLIRSQACLAFIAVDTFSRFQKIFQGIRDEKELNGDNEKRFKDWLNEFVFTARNTYYKKHKDKIRCDVGVIWKLRNSFIHFYSFPQMNAGQDFIGFSFNIPKEECREMENAVKKRLDKGIVFVDIYHLIEAIFQGLLLQWQDLAEMIGTNPEKYMDSIIFSHKIVMQSNASTIRVSRIKYKRSWVNKIIHFFF